MVPHCEEETRRIYIIYVSYVREQTILFLRRTEHERERKKKEETTE